MRGVLVLLLIGMLSLALGDDDYKKRHYYKKDLSCLNLSQTQQEDVREILKEHRKEMKDFRKYKKELLEQSSEIFEKDELDEVGLININEKLGKKASNIRVKMLSKIHKILSKDQREKFIEQMDEWGVDE